MLGVILALLLLVLIHLQLVLILLHLLLILLLLLGIGIRFRSALLRSGAGRSGRRRAERAHKTLQERIEWTR